MDVWEAIRNKRAVRNFSDEPLPEDIAQRILDAGRRAQSSKNTQPWDFVVIQERARLELLAQTGDYLTHVTGAALCVVMIMPAEDARGWKMFDLGQSASYMQKPFTPDALKRKFRCFLHGHNVHPVHHRRMINAVSGSARVEVFTACPNSIES